MAAPIENRDDMIRYLGKNRIAAHQILFKHRHPDLSPDFHARIATLWHSHLPRGLVMAFREAGKSTIAEEAIILMALLHEFKNGVIIGENEARAADRLNSIKYELLMNEQIRALFGEQIGEVWGMKHLDTRPDLLFGDDLESKEHVRDAAARHDTLQWLFAEVMPALDKNARVRIQATPLDREALPMTIAGMPGWKILKFPIRYRDAAGEWAPSWPGRYPLDWVDRREQEMYRLGLHHDFMREYMRS